MTGIMKSESPDLSDLIGKRIRKFRMTAKMSQEELAEKSGLHRTYISSCERGTRNITVVNLNRICGALCINLGTFFNASIKEDLSD